MSDSQTAEDKALEQVDSLVLFASENLKDLPADAIKTIAELRAKQPSGWTPDELLNFWTSFNKLCLAIKPVTLDTLASNEATIPRPRRVFWRRSDLKISLSKRTAQRYLSLLLILLFLSLAFQFVAATLVGLTSEIEKLLADADKLNAERSEEIVAIESDVGQRKFSDPLLSTEVKKAIASIQDKDNKVKFDVDQALVKANLFQRLATFGLKPLDYFSSRYNPRETIADAKNGIVEYDSVRSSIGRAIDRSSLTLRLLNAVVLPIFSGTLGACAYVTRSISDQIKDTTFSATSLIRYRVRVALGALVGAVVGFGWIEGPASLSPLAWAFVAGYAIEPIFAAIDSIAEKFGKQS